MRAGTPENRFLRLINEIFLNEYGKSAQDFRFVFGIKRQIGMFPIAEHAESFELFPLKIDVLQGESVTAFAHFDGRQIARFLYHFVFDWQPVTIPARNIGRALAEHRLRFQDEIF